MKYYAIAIIPLILAYPAYSIFYPSPSLEEIQNKLIQEQNELIEKTNNTKLERYKQELIECMQSASGEILKELSSCSNRPKPILQELVGTNAKATTGSVIPEPPKSGSKDDKVIREDYKKTPTAETCSFPISNVKMVVIHYTAGDGNAENVERTHTNKYQDKDWSAIHTYPSSYHYLIEKDGSIVRPRSETCGSLALGASATMRNDETINISYIGTGKPTPKQLDSLVSLTRDIQDRYGLTRDSVTAHADIQSKNKAESMDGMFGSKAEFVKKLRIADSVSIYGKQSPELTYMWSAWGDKDFIGTIFQESRMSNKANGDGGQSIGYCQIHKGYQPGWYAEYSKLDTMEARLNYCHELYTYSATLPGGVGSRFHGYNARAEHVKNLLIQ